MGDSMILVGPCRTRGHVGQGRDEGGGEGDGGNGNICGSWYPAICASHARCAGPFSLGRPATVSIVRTFVISSGVSTAPLPLPLSRSSAILL